MRGERLTPPAPRPAATAVGVVALLFLTFGGYVKGLPALADVGDTLTRLSALVVLVMCAHRILSGRTPPAATWGVVVLFVAFVPAMLVDTPTTYTTEKLTVQLPLMFLTIFGGLLLLADSRARRQWITAIVVLGAVVAILALVFPNTTVVDALAVEGGNTISQGRATGAAAIALLTLAMVQRKHRLLLIAGALVMAASMVAAGSRGPAMGAAVAVVLAVAFSPGRGRGPRMVATFVTLVAVVYLAFAANLVGDRLLTLHDTSAEARRRLWDVGVGLMGTDPLGIGWGQLYYYLPPGTRLPGVGVREYPHNVLIEVGSEAGLPALVALVVVLVMALRGQQRVSTSPAASVMLALLVFALINSMVSGDVGDNRGLWVAVGAGLAICRTSFSNAAADVGVESGARDTSARGILTSPRSSQWPK